MINSVVFPRQIGRVSFFIRYVLFLGAAWFAALLLATGLRLEQGIVSIAFLLGGAVVPFVALFYLIRHILIARLRDVGLHSLWTLLIFVPIVNFVFTLVLLFSPRGAFVKSSS